MKKFKFSELPYQTKATQAVVDIFLGQTKGSRKEIISREGMFIEEIFSNKKIEISESDKLKNIQSIQKDAGLPVSKETFDDNFTVEMETGTGKTYVYTQTMFELNKQYGWSKFIIMVPSIAIREGVKQSLDDTQEHFYEKYGKKIRFFIYDTKNKSNLINIKNFANTNNIEVIIMNYQAFATNSEESKKIYQPLDSLQSEKPIEIIRRARPILIIDEPQKFGPTAEKKLIEFKPLFKIRYSATLREYYNLVYRLDSIQAFNEKLVKKIKVKGFEVIGGGGANSYLYLERIQLSDKSYPVAYLEFEVRQKNGTKKIVRKIKEGDNIFDMSNQLNQYKGYVVSEINGLTNRVKFTNGVEISVGQAHGDVDEKHLRRIQIRETIASHLQREREMYKRGIKVLSLFFIDEVAKYRKYDEKGNPLKGEYEEIFEEEYLNAISQRDLFDEDYNKYLDKYSAEQVHNGYFSIDKRKTTESRFVDTSGETQLDTGTYELIMKKKKELLSFNEPTRFIFSHSALREGWDNPNIFQICTLKHSDNTISKTQEIGRGLRVCVDQDLTRLDSEVLQDEFFDINSLTVVASESYESFAKALQGEIFASLSDRPTKLSTDILKGRILVNKEGEEMTIDEFVAMDLIADLKGKRYIDENYYITEEFIGDIDNNKVEVIEKLKDFKEEILNLMKRVYETANYQKDAIENEKAENFTGKLLKPNENFAKKEFQDLWDKIKIKTLYEVDFNSEELINNVIQIINKELEVKKSLVRMVEGGQEEVSSYESLRDSENIKISREEIKAVEVILGDAKYDLINELVEVSKITRKTAAEILMGITEEKFALYKLNPEDFIRKVSLYIEEQKATTLINNIIYHKTDETYEDEIFTINNFNGSLQSNILEVKRHIYDYLKTDSKQEIEFAKRLEEGEVSVYAKLPNAFKIPTPVGDYNPDWAIVFDSKEVKYIYFIAETKGSMSSLDLRGKEKLKIDYARKHFSSLNDSNIKYDVISNYDELLQKVLN